MVRVAYCIDSFEIGGTELNAVRTVESLPRDEFELVVFHLHRDGPLRSRYEAAGVELVHVSTGPLYTLQAFRSGSAWRTRVVRPSFDLIHTHDVYTNAWFGLWGLAASPRCGIITSRRWSGDVPNRGLAWANSLAWRAADRVLANSPSLGRLLVSEGVPERKVAHIPNFLDDWAFLQFDSGARHAWRLQHGIPPSACLIGVVARLSEVKNHSMLLSAFSRLPSDCWLAIVGDGPLRARLQEEAQSAGVADRVRFLGAMTGRTNLHAPFDISVLCSNDEGFPNAIIEAMAAERPVVATAVGGVTDVVEHGRNGLLVHAEDSDALAEALLRLRSDPVLRASYGEAGRRLVAERHSARAVISALKELYRQVVWERGRGLPARVLPHPVQLPRSGGEP